eukprot:TRINITY_DN3158_c0_g1_i2.p1 TRINITY_DN3158_c0_g1~~TRINITY_DN3158_c0_g1_i2.p1  ORF type:complete len:786 (-),score=309.43 TRINITY_DN3158_c0_g1_i2:117-2387(-)
MVKRRQQKKQKQEKVEEEMEEDDVEEEQESENEEEEKKTASKNTRKGGKSNAATKSKAKTKSNASKKKKVEEEEEMEEEEEEEKEQMEEDESEEEEEKEEKKPKATPKKRKGAVKENKTPQKKQKTEAKAKKEEKEEQEDSESEDMEVEEKKSKRSTRSKSPASATRRSTRSAAKKPSPKKETKARASKKNVKEEKETKKEVKSEEPDPDDISEDEFIKPPLKNSDFKMVSIPEEEMTKKQLRFEKFKDLDWRDLPLIGVEEKDKENIYGGDFKFDHLIEALKHGILSDGPHPKYMFMGAQPIDGMSKENQVINIPYIVVISSRRPPSEQIAITSVQSGTETVIPGRIPGFSYHPYVPRAMQKSYKLGEPTPIHYLADVRRDAVYHRMNEQEQYNYALMMPYELFPNDVRKSWIKLREVLKKRLSVEVKIPRKQRWNARKPRPPATLIWDFECHRSAIHLEDMLKQEGCDFSEEGRKAAFELIMEAGRKKLDEMKEDYLRKKKQIKAMSKEDKKALNETRLYKYYPTSETIRTIHLFKKNTINRFYGNADAVDAVYSVEAEKEKEKNENPFAAWGNIKQKTEDDPSQSFDFGVDKSPEVDAPIVFGSNHNGAAPSGAGMSGFNFNAAPNAAPTTVAPSGAGMTGFNFGGPPSGSQAVPSGFNANVAPSGAGMTGFNFGVSNTAPAVNFGAPSSGSSVATPAFSFGVSGQFSSTNIPAPAPAPPRRQPGPGEWQCACCEEIMKDTEKCCSTCLVPRK